MQHAKFNAKPKQDKTAASEVAWHQDFPFFPHTNYDLVACVIHLDDEEADSGPLAFIPGSHKHGEQPHVDEQGNFIYRCAGDMGMLGKGVPVIAKRGWVGFHHGLTVHSSAPKTNDLDRRFVVFQYRAQDAVQLAGVIWRCNGYAVSEQRLSPPRARMVDGHVIPMRGNGGRLYDLYAALKPNTAPKSY